MKTEKLVTDVAVPAKNSRLRENVEAILIAIVIALFIRTFVVQAFKIPSGSMKQTLLVGDHILVNKFIYGVKLPYLNTVLLPLKGPRHGDIVVFKYPVDPQNVSIGGGGSIKCKPSSASTNERFTCWGSDRG